MFNIKLNPVLTNIIKVLIFGLVFFSSIYIMRYYSDKSFNKEMDELQLNGKIVSKYSDKEDHNINKLIIVDKQDSMTLDLANESSGMFEFTQVSDSIYKKKMNRKVRVFNTAKDSTFEIIF